MQPRPSFNLLEVQMNDEPLQLTWLDCIDADGRLYVAFDQIKLILEHYYDPIRHSKDHYIQACGAVQKAKISKAYMEGDVKYFKELHNLLITRDKKIMLANVKKLYEEVKDV